MSGSILPFKAAQARAEAACTPAEIREVLAEVSVRLGRANSALAVDCAKQLLDIVIQKGAA